MKRNFWTIPNLLSITRALLIVPFVVVMLSSMEGKRIWGVVILLLGALTDKLDGVFARRMNCESEWGRILDPLADKSGIAAVALVLLWMGDLPPWFVILLLIRDLLIFFGGLYIRQRTGIVPPSNMAGKWTVGVFSLTLFGALIQIPGWALLPLLILSTGMAVVSFALYLQRFISTIRRKQST
jgi:CDP-diacylglycerol--glycerol-3-phosphate 3-phosphatidyltransferase